MTLIQHLVFLTCAVVAGYVQNLTGFAFGLILLGMVGLMAIAPITDVANVVSVLMLVNAAMVFYTARPKFEIRVIGPTMGASLIGVTVGVLLLNWLSDTVVHMLSMLLGVTIVACAVILAQDGVALAHRSPLSRFIAFGAISGVLGGLFSAAGPPLVYHFYRQPIALRAIREGLIAIFAANALLRLGMMLPSGRFSANALILSLETVPLILLQTYWMARRPTTLRVATIKQIVCVMLALVGLGLVLSSAISMGLFEISSVRPVSLVFG